MEKPNNLLIDAGNSAIKVCCGNSNGIIKNSFKFKNQSDINKPESSINFLEDYITEIKNKNFTSAGISVLSSQKKNILKKFFSERTDISPVFIDRRLRLPFSINYSSSLGNDRICSAAGASSIFRNKNLLVIDFGTATTFTLISDKVLEGGIICPGIKTSLSSLISKTSLPETALTFPKQLFGNDTKHNIRAGVLYQALYSAERIITEADKIYGGVFTVATGGMSGFISRRTKLINATDKFLVLKGINFILNNQ